MMEPAERIILKSIELFTLYGIRQVTMDQIAEEVGMSKRTIYELFKDKDKLVWECMETMHRQHLAEVQRILNTASNVIEALYTLGQHGEKKKSLINRSFFEDIKKLYPAMWETMKQRNKPGPGSFSYKIFTKGIEEGIFNKDINIEIVDAFIHIMMETFHKKDIYPENTTDKDLLKNIIIPYYMGISTEKGKKLIEQYIPLTLL
jgi:TetR/AcrR family transcriptional regulator, cholesterol catabolism regulator